MIVPNGRLIFFASAFWVPLLAATGLFVFPWSAWAFALFLFSLLLVISDIVFSLNLLEGVRVTLPDIARLTKDRPGEIPIHVERTRLAEAVLRIGIPFPSCFRTNTESVLVELDSSSPVCVVTWEVVAVDRGKFCIDEVYVEVLSRWKFWRMRACLSQTCEVRVYPNLASDQRVVAALFLNRGFWGIHRQRQVGKGREFEKLREYIPGDGLEDIHWKATAKRGKPVSKVYQIERTQEVYVVIDSARLSARVVGETVNATGNRPNMVGLSFLERFLSVSLLLERVAERQGDRFGLVVFDDAVRRFVRASTGKTHFGTCRDALYTLEPRMTNPDFYELCSFLRARLTKRALLLFLTSLDDPVLAEQFLRGIDLVARKHVVIVHMFRPGTIEPLFFRRPAETVDDVYRALAGHLHWRELRELERALWRRGIPLGFLDNERMSAQLVSSYINLRQRQLL